MKRLVLFLAFAMAISSVGFAQKANVSKAKNKALATENPDLAGAKELIEEALVNEETKNQANTWFVAGTVYERSASLGAEADAAKAYEYYLKAYELDQLPNEKGKVAPKFNKKIAASMSSFYRSNILVNYAISHYNKSEYKDAIRAFEMHTDIPDLAVMTVEKEPLVKDSIFYQVRYYTALCEYLDNNIPEATIIYEEIKDKGYEENRIHQYLYDIYKNNNDTANFVRILNIGMERFPDDFFYLGNLINYFVFSGQKDQAISFLDQAIANEPNNPQYYYVKGTLLEDDKNYVNAAVFFDKAIELDPNNADYWIARGRLYYNSGFQVESDATLLRDFAAADAKIQEAKELYKQSLKYFEKGAELNPNDYDNLKTLRSLYYRFQSEDKSYEEKYNRVNEMMNK